MAANSDFRLLCARFLVVILMSAGAACIACESFANTPVAHWTFDDGTANDQSGNGRHGTVLGGAGFISSPLGQALTLDGVDDQVAVPNAPQLNPASGITLAAWVRPASFAGTGNDPIVDKGFTSHLPPYYQYHLGVTGDQYVGGPDHAQFVFSLSINGQFTLINTPNNTWVPGTWYHVVGTYNGSDLKLYVNGLQIATANAPGTITAYNSDVHFGRYGNANNYLPGQVDDIRLYDHALTLVQVTQLYGRTSAPIASWQTLAFLMIAMLSAGAIWAVGRNPRLSTRESLETP